MATAQEMQSAFTVPELASAARARVPSIGLASAYRAVASLEEAGWLERVGSRDGSALYVRCAQGEHHHHMVCTSCGVVEHAECPLDSVIQQAADAVGFTVESHSVELYGICRSCADMCEETA
jgi:Fur family ferric uptake transcriptional regulator